MGLFGGGNSSSSATQNTGNANQTGPSDISNAGNNNRLTGQTANDFTIAGNLGAGDGSSPSVISRSDFFNVGNGGYLDVESGGAPVVLGGGTINYITGQSGIDSAPAILSATAPDDNSNTEGGAAGFGLPFNAQTLTIGIALLAAAWLLFSKKG